MTRFMESESASPMIPVEPAPVLPPPPAVDFTLVDTPEALEQLLVRIAGVQRVALDTEADSLHCYREKLCLLQITIEESGGVAHFLVDPLALPDLSGLRSVIQDRVLILHGASYDLKMLQTGGRFEPRFLIDTEWAAKLLGLRTFGLAALVGSELGFGLSKQHQKADWGRRPLPSGMQAYAVNDTRFLPELTDRLLQRLETLGRRSWLDACCERMLATSLRNAENVEAVEEERWRISGSGKLQPRQLEILRRAWLWRDEIAAHLDRPVFRVASNDILLEVAIQGPAASILQTDRKFPDRWKRDLHRALREAMETSDQDLPQRIRGRRTENTEDWDAKCEHLKRCRDAAAAELGLDAGILAPRKALERLAAGDDVELHLMGWQTEALSNAGATFSRMAG